MTEDRPIVFLVALRVLYSISLREEGGAVRNYRQPLFLFIIESCHLLLFMDLDVLAEGH